MRASQETGYLRFRRQIRRTCCSLKNNGNHKQISEMCLEKSLISDAEFSDHPVVYVRIHLQAGSEGS